MTHTNDPTQMTNTNDSESLEHVITITAGPTGIYADLRFPNKWDNNRTSDELRD